MNPLMLPVLMFGLAWQGQPHEPQQSGEDNKEAARRLQVMKDSVASYDIFASKDRKVKLTLLTEPQLRWSNPVCGITDGSFFVWSDGDRPEVAIQVFLVPEKLWVHEFSSLSPRTPVAELNKQPCWTPIRPGIEFKPVPDTPVAAETPQARLRQMKAMANEFTASDEFEGTSWWELRLLTTPLIRYGKPGTEVVDGAMFAFVHGTDPEVLLLLEARPSDRGSQWHYALAPMTAYAIKVSWKGQMVWSLPWRKSELQKPSDPFFLRLYSREGE